MPDILRTIGIPLIIIVGILIIAGGIRPTGIDLKNLAYLLLLSFIRSSAASGIQALLTFLGTASLGALLAVMTYKHGTIWPSVFVHMIMNSKERFIGFDKSSSLFVFDFVNTPVETQLIICWGMVSIISAITTLIYLRKSKKAEMHPGTRIS